MTVAAGTPIVMLKKRRSSAFGHTFGVRVQRVQKVQRVQRERWTAALQPKGHGFAVGCVEGLYKRVQRIDRPVGPEGSQV